MDLGAKLTQSKTYTLHIEAGFDPRPSMQPSTQLSSTEDSLLVPKKKYIHG